MKKIFLFILISLLILTLSGCPKKQTTADDTSLDSGRQDVVLESDSGKTDITDDKTTVKETSASEEKKSDASDKQTIASAEIKPTALPKLVLKKGEEGIITMIDGDVDVIRQGVSLGPDVEEGLGLQNYDLVKTMDKSQTEIEVLSPNCPHTVITMAENTTFSFDINKLEAKDQTTLNVMGGTLLLKVDTIAKDQDLVVTNGEVAMGVRGTTFSVSTLPSGDTLVTCKTGKVECRDASGKTVMARPGRVVEKSGAKDISEFDVDAAKIDVFREEWLEEKIRLLKKNALDQIKKYVGSYEKRAAEFEKAYDALMAETAIISKWKEEDKQGKTGSTMEVMKEKKKVISHIFRIRKILFWFEHLYYRLAQLKKFHDQGYGAGQIRDGLSTADFFNSFSKADIEKKLIQIRYICKLFAKRNEGSVPAGIENESSDDEDDDFFGDYDF